MQTAVGLTPDPSVQKDLESMSQLAAYNICASLSLTALPVGRGPNRAPTVGWSSRHGGEEADEMKCCFHP